MMALDGHLELYELNSKDQNEAQGYVCSIVEVRQGRKKRIYEK